MIIWRRRYKQSDALERRLADEAARLREEAGSLPPGAVREQALRQARLCEAGSHISETGSHIGEWLRSVGLRPHK